MSLTPSTPLFLLVTTLAGCLDYSVAMLDAPPTSEVKDTASVIGDTASVTGDTASAVEVENTAPVAEVTLTPDPAYVGNDLTCTASAYDVEGDPIHYIFSWAVNGVPFIGAYDEVDASHINGVQIVEGETWTCSVVADDGMVASAPVSASTTVTGCSSLSFDGSDYVVVPASADFPKGDHARTTTVWVKARGYGVVNLFTFGSGQDTNSRWSILLESASSMKLVGEDHDYWFTHSGLAVWTHIAMVYDGNTLFYYENGLLKDTATVYYRFDTRNDLELIIGSNSLDRTDEYFDGNLRELRVWNRVLSDVEVAADVTATVADPTDLVGQWAMSDGVGGTVSDVSGHGHDGTIMGATWVYDCP